MRVLIALLASIPLLIIAGCKKQSQEAAQHSAPATAEAATPSTSARPTSPPISAPVYVYAAPSSTPNAPQVTGVSQEAPLPEGRLDLAQSEESVVLQGPARAALETALSGGAGSGTMLLADPSAAALIDSLPRKFRDSCAGMLAGWGQNVNGGWKVRVLFSMQHTGGTEGVLAFRCAPTTRGLEQDYDERPAAVSVTSEAVTLHLIPLAKDCAGCEDLYHVEFSQAFTAVGTKLAELRVYSSSDNPCCGGPEEESATRLVIVNLSTGKPILTLEQSRERDSEDDEDGDTITVCGAKIEYGRDGGGNVETIASETRCKENKKPLPEVKRQNFRWNAEAHRFDEVR